MKFDELLFMLPNKLQGLVSQPICIDCVKKLLQVIFIFVFFLDKRRVVGYLKFEFPNQKMRQLVQDSNAKPCV